jgi:hypothetical protein
MSCLTSFEMNIKLLYLIVFSGASEAHMSLWYPPPLGGARKANPLTSDVDSRLNFPLGCCDTTGAPTLISPGDCRGHLNLLDSEEGKPQVTWESGQHTYFQISDYKYTADVTGSTHYGGSCQVGFSTDKGRTWKVAASYHGNCPHRHESGLQTFHFTVPTSMPSGPAVFAWIWLNREHESFMNCASVWISEGPGDENQAKAQSNFAVQSSTGVRPTDRRQKENELGSFSSAYKKSTSTSPNRWNFATPTGSHWESLTHTHRRKHFKYYNIRSKKPAPQPCDWASTPTMTVSYYTVDAKCAANAKLNNADSDSFEIGWTDACGVVVGDGEYPIRGIKCD